MTQLSSPSRVSVWRRAGRVPGRRRGFNFTEVLFAVMILGMGFIMVAAIFPATIRQTANNMEDAAGANVAKGAAQAIQSIANDKTMPATANSVSKPGEVRPLPKTTSTLGFQAARGNFIASQNPRYGWVALYKRDMTDTGPAPYAQVIIIATQSRNKPEYAFEQQFYNDNSLGWSDVQAAPSPYNYATLEPRDVVVDTAYNSSTLTSTVTFKAGTGGVIAPGTYLVIGDDKKSGEYNGRIYQVGLAVNEAGGVWELIPGADQTVGGAVSTDADLTGAIAYVVGRGYTDQANRDYSYSGPAQDIGVYTTFVRVEGAPAASTP